ncbi:unnamed protein product [Schistocephalus solidus]|uniref:Secreted protein n=1 Tax=Schistocephalus solidus TaxID=70667 RepID=A0A183SNV3_SCHSO|nr:unnamed protein product [Schistocephalus solidus]
MCGCLLLTAAASPSPRISHVRARSLVGGALDVPAAKIDHRRRRGINNNRRHLRSVLFLSICNFATIVRSAGDNAIITLMSPLPQPVSSD